MCMFLLAIRNSSPSVLPAAPFWVIQQIARLCVILPKHFVWKSTDKNVVDFSGGSCMLSVSLFAVTHCMTLNNPASWIDVCSVHGLGLRLWLLSCCVLNSFSASVSPVNLVLMGFLYAFAGVSLNHMRFHIHFAVLNEACACKKF